MNKRRIMVTLAIILSSTLFCSSALAEDTGQRPSVGIKILDLIIIRPISA